MVDELLIKGESLRNIAQRCGDLDHTAIFRHKQSGHLPPSLVRLHERREEKRGHSLLDKVEELEEKARSILDASESEGRHTVSLAALRELRGIVELLGRLTGELKEGAAVTVNVLNTNEWTEVRNVVLGALEHHPDARTAVAEGLAQLEESSDG